MNRWTWLNLSFLIPFSFVQISRLFTPYHYQVLVFYNFVAFDLLLPLLILSHILAIATIVLSPELRDRWSTAVIVWFSFLILLLGTHATIASGILEADDSGNLRGALWIVGLLAFMWRIWLQVAFFICVAMVGLLMFRRRLTSQALQRWAIVMFWIVIYYFALPLWSEAATNSDKTINSLTIEDRQLYLVERSNLGGIKRLIYNCNTSGFFCNTVDFYDSYTIGSFSYWRDPATNKLYIRQENKKVLLPD